MPTEIFISLSAGKKRIRSIALTLHMHDQTKSVHNLAQGRQQIDTRKKNNKNKNYYKQATEMHNRPESKKNRRVERGTYKNGKSKIGLYRTEKGDQNVVNRIYVCFESRTRWLRRVEVEKNSARNLVPYAAFAMIPVDAMSIATLIDSVCEHRNTIERKPARTRRKQNTQKCRVRYLHICDCCSCKAHTCAPSTAFTRYGAIGWYNIIEFVSIVVRFCTHTCLRCYRHASLTVSISIMIWPIWKRS